MITYDVFRAKEILWVVLGLILADLALSAADPTISSITTSSETGEVWDDPVDSDGSLEDSRGSKGAFWIPGHVRS